VAAVSSALYVSCLLPVLESAIQASRADGRKRRQQEPAAKNCLYHTRGGVPNQSSWSVRWSSLRAPSQPPSEPACPSWLAKHVGRMAGCLEGASESGFCFR
jgi:hypothetical protein